MKIWSLRSLISRLAATKQLYRNLYGTFVALWLLFVVIVPYAQAQVAEEVVAQKPFVATIVNGMALTKDSSGTPLAVTMPQGINSLLEVINLRTSQRTLLAEQRTDNQEVSGQAYVTLPNRHVLIGTSSGVVYDVNPDQLTATPQSPEDASHLTFLHGVMGDADMVYFTATTQTDSRLYSYNYVTTTWHNIGTSPDMSGGVAFDQGKLYIGGGQDVAVWSINAQSGNKTQLQLQGAPSGTTNVHVVTASGGYLYLTAQVAAQPATLVYSLLTNMVIDQQPDLGSISEPMLESAVPKAPSTTATPADSTANTSAGTATPQGASSQAVDKTTNANITTTSQDQTNLATSTTLAAQTTSTTSSQPQPTTVQTSVVPAPSLAPIYYGALSQYEPTTKSVKSIAAGHNLQVVSENCWIDASHCVVYSQQGALDIVNTSSRSLKMVTPSPIVGGFHAVGAISIGADDTLYAASSASDPAVLQVDRDNSQLSKIVSETQGQVASMLPVGTSLLVGTGTGVLTEYNPVSQTSEPSFANAVKVGTGSVTALADTGKSSVAFGLSQTGVTPSGAVGLYSSASHSVKLLPQVVLPNQTLASLTYSQGVLFAGGAFSAQSAAPSTGAKLVAYDIANHTVKAAVVPVPGADSITSLAVGSNGHLYGIAGATLFELDSRTLSVIHTKAFYSMDYPGNLLFWHGQLVASVAGKIYDVDLNNLNGTYIANGTHVAVNSLGDYYYSRGGALYRIVAPRHTVAAVTSVQPSGWNFNFSMIGAKLGATTLMLLLLLAIKPILKQHQRHSVYTLRR